MAQTAVGSVAVEIAEPAPPGEVDGEDSQNEPEAGDHPVAKQAKVLDRVARYVKVELPPAIFRLSRAGSSGCWMGRRREFKNFQDFVGLPARTSYTHVCKLCWPKGRGDSESEACEASPAGSGDEEVLEIPSSQPSWDIAVKQLPELLEPIAAEASEADE